MSVTLPFDEPNALPLTTARARKLLNLHRTGHPITKRLVASVAELLERVDNGSLSPTDSGFVEAAFSETALTGATEIYPTPVVGIKEGWYVFHPSVPEGTTVLSVADPVVTLSAGLSDDAVGDSPVTFFSPATWQVFLSVRSTLRQGWDLGEGQNQVVFAGFESGLSTLDPRLLGFDADRGALFGGRLNNGLNAGGELPHGVWDPDLISQYSVTWGWSQVSIGEAIGSAGAKTKGSMQIGYNCANAAQFASLAGIANMALGPGCAVTGGANISGSTTRSDAPVPITYHDNYFTGDVAQIKVAGDLTAEFPVGEYCLFRFLAAIAEGPVATRTSDTAGVFTLSTGAAGTALDVGATLTLKWNGGANGRTLTISASSVVGNVYTVTASGGSGDALPVAGTKVWVAGSAGIGTYRTVAAKPTACSHSGGVTTITLDRQFAVTMDITRTAPEEPVVMNVGQLNSILYGHNSVSGEYNQALGRRGRASGYRNVITAVADGSDVAGTSNTISGNNSFARGTSNTVSSDNAGAIGTSMTISGNRSFGSGTGHAVSGFESTALGASHTITGARCFASGIGNTVGATDNVALGNSITIATGTLNLVTGLSNSVSGSYGLVSGQSNTVSVGADWVSVSGRSHTANDDYVHLSGRGTSSRRYAERTHSAGTLNNAGDMQFGEVCYGGTTTNATQTDLYLDYQESVPAERFDLKTASSATCRLTITATGPGTGADGSSAGSGFQTVSFEAVGRLVRTSTGGTYSWFGPTAATAIDLGVAVSSLSGDGTTVTATTTGEHGLNTGDQGVISGSSVGGYNGTQSVTRVNRTSFTFPGSTTGAATGATVRPVRAWAVALSASTTGLRVQVTGAASTTIKWFGRLDFTECSQ